ncbi:carbamoyl-phosphate synthase large subunit [Alcaligenaceae bacterium]|nr:carbamoyl-phosphate synthase large subunit [Alcaligenaceae bacterium]
MRHTFPHLPQRLLISNRGEIAIRIARAAAELGIEPVCVFSADDARARHRFAVSQAFPLEGEGPAAYLDIEQILGIAQRSGCDAIHPGYGFLSENAGFASRCENAGVTFVGPASEAIELLGNKSRSRQLAQQLGIAVAAGTQGATTLEACLAFYDSLRPGTEMMIKAVAGGGGRGMRVVSSREAIPGAFARCQSEARGAFGCEDVYVEQRLSNMRHIEVQIAGDGRGGVRDVGERDCSVQRRHQKIVEIAPALFLGAGLRERLRIAAKRMAGELQYRALGTFEFLVPIDSEGEFFFMEANPRLQVEHTITEEVYGVDLVQAQILLACGATLDQAGIAADPAPRGCAVQLRVNLESLEPDGSARPARGTLTAFDVPGGPGVRVDTCGYAGLEPSRAFDPLIAKVIVHHPSGRLADAMARAATALADFRIEGVQSNLHILGALAADPQLGSAPVTTTYFDAELPRFLAEAARWRASLPETLAGTGPATAPAARQEAALPPHLHGAIAPMGGRLLSYLVSAGDIVTPGSPVAVLESMKMEHELTAGLAGRIDRLLLTEGVLVEEGDTVLALEPMDVDTGGARCETRVDPGHIRADLAEVIDRHAYQRDESRPEAVASRNNRGKRTARQNLDDLLDGGSFLEYGPLAVAGQRSRRSIEELRRISPADGLVAGTGTVNADEFGPEGGRCMVMAYDYTVFAGTQGFMAHRKSDRILELTERLRLPLVLFAEGGGGRPGDTDNIGGANPSNPTFWRFGRLSALVPLVGILSGRCFAGNAVLLGACDVIIATRDASVGMAGPVMIECGGLGSFSPEEVGPVSVQAPNGVLDVVVEDERAAVEVAKKYLAFFQGRLPTWECADQRALRHIIPENRLRAYDVRRVIDLLADTDSVLELRKDFGLGMVTALARLEGRTIGIMANNPQHLAGAIDADESDKAARFMQLCDAFDIPLLSLVDTPGFMVGPAAEKRALVRHTSRMFVTGAGLSVPMFVVVLRKGYGLGAMAVGGGAFQRAAVSAVSWPTGEFGAMGLEGAVKLAYRNELAAIEDDLERERRYEELVGRMYEHGKAVNMAPFLSFDDVIDPADTRKWLVHGLQMLPPPEPRTGKRRPNIDPW